MGKALKVVLVSGIVAVLLFYSVFFIYAQRSFQDQVQHIDQQVALGLAKKEDLIRQETALRGEQVMLAQRLEIEQSIAEEKARVAELEAQLQALALDEQQQQTLATQQAADRAAALQAAQQRAADLRAAAAQSAQQRSSSSQTLAAPKPVVKPSPPPKVTSAS
jgi:hypothetical protein